jgi:hypothetical protein
MAVRFHKGPTVRERDLWTDGDGAPDRGACYGTVFVIMPKRSSTR